MMKKFDLTEFLHKQALDMFDFNKQAELAEAYRQGYLYAWKQIIEVLSKFDLVEKKSATEVEKVSRKAVDL